MLQHQWEASPSYLTKLSGVARLDIWRPHKQMKAAFVPIMHCASALITEVTLLGHQGKNSPGLVKIISRLLRC